VIGVFYLILDRRAYSGLKCERHVMRERLHDRCTDGYFQRGVFERYALRE
jgi:hypothetical protein